MTGEPPLAREPTVRPLGAWVVGVGLHPLALAAYELMHMGRSRALGVLSRVSIAALAVLELLEIGLDHVPWTVPVLAYALITAGWVKATYTPSTTGSLPGIHRRGLALAIAAYIPILFLQFSH